MSDPGQSSQYGRSWTAILCAALLPLFALALFAAPQTDDLCYASNTAQSGLRAVWMHYHNWSGRVVPTLLIPLPWVVAQLFDTDMFRVYSAFALAFLIGLAVLAYGLVGLLLPNVVNPTKRFLGLALFTALVANAPTTRQLFFWMPAVFTYTLPLFVTLPLFLVLYRSLVEGTWIAPHTFRLCMAGALLSSLCNEFTGPITALMLGLSLLARAPLGLRRPVLTQHALIIGAALLGTLIVYAAPGNLARAGLHPGSSDLAAALWGGTRHTVKFFAIGFLRPGVIGWFLLLALLLGRAPARIDLRRCIVAGAFALLSAVGSAWLSFVAGFYGQAYELPTRAQNIPFLLTVLALSAALIAFSATPRGARAVGWLRTRVSPVVGLVLVLLSPALLLALWQLPQAPAFRREIRAQYTAIANDPQPIVHVAQIETTPSLLFAHPLSPDSAKWPNRCLRRFFGKEAVVPTMLGKE